MSHLKLFKELEDDLKVIRSWLYHQTHLPQNIDDQIIRRFIMSCNKSLEKTKQVIDLNYTIRSQAPEIFANRDPRSSLLQNLLTMGEMIPLPQTTENNYRCLLFRIREKNTDNFVFSDVLKIILMLGDLRLVSELEITDGEVPIFDMANMTLQHLSKMNLSTLRKYMMYTQEAHPVRLRQIHIINIPTFLDKLMMLAKPLIKSEVAAMLNFHTTVQSLFKFIPQEILPNEYGGKAGKIDDLKAQWIKKLDNHREYFMDNSRWTVDEIKRSSDNEHRKPLFGIQGSFRTLSID